MNTVSGAIRYSENCNYCGEIVEYLSRVEWKEANRFRALDRHYEECEQIKDLYKAILNRIGVEINSHVESYHQNES